MLRADGPRSRAMQEARALVEQVSRSRCETRGFDVDVRWARALMDGDQSLEWITESTHKEIIGIYT